MPHCKAACSRNFCCSGCSLFAQRHPLYRVDATAIRLDGQHQARVDEHAVEQNVARPAVAVVAAFLGAGQSQHVAQDLEQALARLAQEFDLVAVNRGGNDTFANRSCVHFVSCLARATAISSARRTSTPTSWRRYSAVPRMSVIGRAACWAAAETLAIVVSSIGCPARILSASGHCQRCRGDSGQGHAATRKVVAVGAHLHPGCRADDGNVHFVARRKAHIGGATV